LLPPSPPPPHAPRAFQVAVSVHIAAASLGSVTVSQLSGAVGDATKSALSGAEQSGAAVARGMELSGTLLLALASGASGAAEREAARSAAEAAACGTNATATAIGLLAATTCTVTIQGRRRLGELELELGSDRAAAPARAVSPVARRRHSFAQFRAQLLQLARSEIGRLTQHRQLSAPRRQLSAVPLTLAMRISLDLERIGGSKPAATAAADALASVGAAAAKALPGAVAFSSATAAALDVIAHVAAVGGDSNDAAAQSDAITSAVAAATALAPASLTVTSLAVTHPPRPPPSPPPAPQLPPAPAPEPPALPSPPSEPPATFDELWGAECNAHTCPHGCRTFMWSDPRAWQGQNNEVGGLWPAFKGNVTIKPCSTVIIDLNLNVQLWSLIIMQQATLVVANRAPTDARPVDVKLRATCIWVQDGGRLLAGRPAAPTSFAPEVPAGHPAILALPRCWQGTCAGLADSDGESGASCAERVAARSRSWCDESTIKGHPCPLTCCLLDPSKSGATTGNCPASLDEHLGAGPFEGRLEIQMSGDDATTGHCGDAGRILRVDGELSP
jgi:hypothetical protein